MAELSMIRAAPPRTRDQVEEIAWQARANLGLNPFEQVPVARLIEHAVAQLVPGFEYRIVEDGKLGSAEAVTDSSLPIITFSARAYDGMYCDRPRARMTAIHELGHLLMHTRQVGYAFTLKHDPLIDTERQADIFAAAFLMPECAFRCMSSIEQAMEEFGVSRDAATCRARTLGMRKLVHQKMQSRSKKKGYGMRRTP